LFACLATVNLSAMSHIITNPYADLTAGNWVRGNLHAHTTASDGKLLPQELVDAYATLGYEFLAITDHDVYTSAADHQSLDDKGLILITGVEATANGPHVLCLNGDSAIEPSSDRQAVIHATLASGGFVIPAHLNRESHFDHTPIEQLRLWDGYEGIEIFNGQGTYNPGSPYSTAKWDLLLTEGRRVWGYANDDAHGLETIALGWNIVYVKERSAAGLIDALTAGRFYASTGVTITDIMVDGQRIVLQTADADRIVAIGSGGGRVAFADQPTIEIDVPDDVNYIRFECWGRGERFAWTQPFFVN
tara:strand:- start:2388 stop:3299 length:912 start_codon:yes stop_codon:yes gene_type:complete